MISVPYTIKNLYHQDHCYKNIRIHFPNGERSDICNNLIVKDSVSFTESLCSQNTLKFGLCESPIFECEVVGVGNIKGATIEVSVEIECPFSASGAEWKADLQKYVYSIPYGTFVVDSCQRQADMNHRKIVAYAGFATNRWEISEIEREKGGYEASGEYYTPNSAMFMAANGFDIIDSITEKETVTFPAQTDSLEYNFDLFQFPGESEYYKIIVKFSGGHDINAQDDRANDRLYQFQKPLYNYSRSELKNIIDAYANYYGMDIPSKASYIRNLNRILDLVFNGGIQIYKSNSLTNSIVVPGGINLPFYTYNNLQNSNYRVRLWAFTQIYIYTIDWGSHYSREQYITLSTDTFKLDKRSYRYTNRAYWAMLRYSFEANIIPANSGLSRPIKLTPNFDELDLQTDLNGIVELAGQFVRTKRDATTEMLNLKRQFGLIPDTDLYPGMAVYPESVTGGTLQPKDYQSCWYDDEYTKPFGRIRCVYKNNQNEQIEYSLYMQGFSEEDDESQYQIYDISDNPYIKNGIYSESVIQGICNTIANELTSVSWMPVEFVGRGLPYVESGDTFEILTKSNDSITTIVLNRTLTGEQTLTDTYKSV